MSNFIRSMDEHFWLSIDKRMCLVKTLLGKILWEKNLMKEKKCNILYSLIQYCLSRILFLLPHVYLHH